MPHCDRDLIKLWLRFNFESQFSQGLRSAAWMLSKVSAHMRRKKAGTAVDDRNADHRDEKYVLSAIASDVEALRKRLCALAGVALVYSLWALIAWIVFTCAFPLPRVACFCQVAHCPAASQIKCSFSRTPALRRASDPCSHGERAVLEQLQCLWS